MFKRFFTLLTLLVCSIHLANAAYLSRPELVDFNFSGANICEKITVRIKFDHEQFNPGNVFTVEVSPNGTFTAGNIFTMIGSLTQSGNQQNVFMNVDFPANIPAGPNFRLRVRGSNPLTYSSQLNEFPFSISKLIPSDPNFYPSGYWRGYFYKWTPSIPGTIANADNEDIFNPANYLGYITEDSLSFDYNWGNSTSAPSTFPDTNRVCGSYRDFFSIRMRRRIAFEEGYYLIGGGADDGFRFSTDGGNTWLINDWNDHSYRGSMQNNGCGVFMTAGIRDVVVEFYENRTDARFRLILKKTGNPAVDPISITFPANGATICAGAGVIQMQGNPPGSFQWSGPGVSAAGQLNPSVGGLGPRTITYQTGFNAFGSNCVKTASITVNVVPGVSAQFSGLDTAYCLPISIIVNLNALNPGGIFSGPGVSGNTFSPGAAGPGLHEIVHIINTPGGCSDTVRKKVRVSALTTVSITNLPASICTNAQPIVLAANIGGGTFSGPGVTAGIFSPATISPGLITISYSLTAGGCQNNGTAQVNVLAPPQAAISVSQSTFCQGQSGKWKVNLSPAGGSFFSSPGVVGDSLSVASLAAGNYFLRYAVDAAGCSDTASFPFTVNALPNAGFNDLPDTVCVGASNITLIPVEAGGQFVGQGVAPPNQFVPSILLPDNTFKIEYVISKNGCSNRSEQFVHILSKLKPRIEFQNLKNRYCTSDAVFLPSSQPAGLYYLNGNPISEINPAALVPGVYSLLAVYQPINTLTCIDSASARFNFTIISTPKPDLGPDKEVESGLSITVDPRVAGPYVWLASPEISGLTANQPATFTPPADMTLKVTAFDPSNTCSGTDEINIMVVPKLVFPSLITPNGDGKNDTWEIEGAYPNMQVKIFNRWGKEIYKGNTVGKLAWKGEEAHSPGTYFFTVTNPSDGRIWSGWIQVLF